MQQVVGRRGSKGQRPLPKEGDEKHIDVEQWDQIAEVTVIILFKSMYFGRTYIGGTW